MNSKRAILILTAIIFSVTTAQASHDYNIEPLGEPQSYDFVSNESQSFRAVNLTYNNQPVSPENLAADQGEFIYEYPESGTFNDTMQYFNDGIWYANIQTLNETADINYTARNETEASLHIYAEESETLDVSELKIKDVEIMQMESLDDPVKAGRAVTLRLDVENTTDGSQEQNADVNIRFVNGTYSTSVVNVGYNDADNLFRTSLDMPDYTNQKFIGQITAEDGSEQSSYSFEINTKPAVEGNIDRLESLNGGCNANSMPEQCEGNATLEAGYNVTSVPAESVNMTVWKHDNQGNPVKHTEYSLARNGSKPSSEPGYYSAEFDFPFINRSQYGNEVKLMFNASTDNREDIDNYTIDYRSFRANIDLEKGYAYQSGEMTIPLTLERYFTLNTVEEDEIRELDVNVTDPNGEIFESYDLNNVSLGTDEQYTEVIDIPGDAMTGDYQIDLFVEDVFRANKTVMRSFSVRENTQTFELSDDTLEPEFQRAGDYSTEMNITDISGTGLNMSVDVSSDLQDILDMPTDFEVENGQMRTLDLNWNIDEVQEYSGELEFKDEDSNYNTTVDVNTQSPDCQFQNGNLCSLTSKDIEHTMAQRETDELDFEILNIGQADSTRDVSISVSGNISDYVEVVSSASFSDNQVIPFNLTAQERGVFTGSMTVSSSDSELVYDLVLDSNVPSGAPQVDVTESVEIGPLVEGESATADVTMDNTGEVAITNISISSETYNIEADTEGMEIPEDSSDTIEVTFNDVSSSSGQLSIDLEALEEATETVDVTAQVYSDYGTRIDNLFDDIQNLRDSTGNQQALSTLDEAETTLDSAEVSWENGNYEEAVNTYEDADSTYQQAQSTVDSSEPENPGGSDPGTSPEDPGTEQPDPGTEQPDDNGGGRLPILPIIIVLVLLIAGGFVFYESYIPEEGDPLYDVLGQ